MKQKTKFYAYKARSSSVPFVDRFLFDGIYRHGSWGPATILYMCIPHLFEFRSCCKREGKKGSDSALDPLHHTWLCARLGGGVGGSACYCGVGATVGASTACAETVAVIHVAVYSWVGLVCEVGVVGSGVVAADAGAARVMVAVAQAGLARVEIGLCWLLHQVAVVGPRSTVV
jgi:hypothetical protein